MENYYLLVLTTLAIVIAPGVDSLLVTKNTLAVGFKGGFQTAIGICSGLVVHTIAAVLGLTAIVAKSVLLFEIVKYAGAAYLIYMGILSFLSENKPLEEKQERPTLGKTGHSYFLQGMLSNVLNPKTVLFYFTFIPQFIVPNGHVVFQIILASATIMILGFLWLIFYSFMLTYVRKWFEQPKVQSVFQKLTGMVLISLGFKIMLEKR